MDISKTALELILQFLDEHSYKSALRELIRESGVQYEGGSALVPGRLISLIEKNLTQIHQNSSLDAKENSIIFPAENKKQKPSNYATVELVPFYAIGGGTNVLISFLNKEGFLISGCGNKKISILQLKCPILSEGYLMEQPRSIEFHSAGVVALDIHPKNPFLIASGSMDHTVVLFNLTESENFIQKLNDHQKFVVRVKWAPSGSYLVSASYDKTFIVYRYDEDKKELFKIESYSAQNQIEGLAFMNNEDSFIISMRGCYYLQNFSIKDEKLFEGEKINLNELGDDHCSFNAMDISFSPNNDVILVSTDRQQALLIDSKGGNHIGRHYGFIGDELSQPRHCWHPDGRYFYETCQDNSINVVCVRTQTVIQRLVGHTQLVRHLSYSKEHEVLVSSSFDGSVRLWKH